MKNILRGAGILAAIAAVFMLMTACAPNKAMTRTNDGAASHGYDKKAEYASDDQTYMDSEEFSVDNRDVEQPAKVKAKPRKPAPEIITDEEEPVTVKSAARPRAEAEDTVGVAGENDRYYQTGIASWYGREFHGKKTASGEKFDMNELTAAHKTLPLGSVIMVKNLDNGNVVKVRVNDRGPFKGKRILDLSFAAAKKLNMVSDGEAMVGIKVLGAGSRDYSSRDDVEDDSAVAGTDDLENTPRRRQKSAVESVPDESGSFALQTGAFYSKRNADKLKDRLADVFPDNDVSVFRDGDLYKVRVLNITSRKTADRFKKTLAGEEIDCFIVEQD